MSLGDSIHNLQLVKKFCCECLPREINFLTLEDLLYLHPSIKENVLAFVSDLLFMFVITKANCVTKKRDIVPKEPSRIPLESKLIFLCLKNSKMKYCITSFYYPKKSCTSCF